MRQRLAALAIALLVVACASDPYPLRPGPPGAALLNPAAVGSSTNATLIYMELRPGDRIELLGAEALGSTDGASIRFLVTRYVPHDDGTFVIGETFEPLEGAVGNGSADTGATPGPDRIVGIAAELTAHRPGRYEVTAVRLRYRLNGGGEQVGEGIDVAWTVCADEPAPADCPE
jgi:hypothetical protein